MKTRKERLIQILSRRGVCPKLARETNTSLDDWANIKYGKRRITDDDYDLFLMVYPEYEYWVLVGITDVTKGQISPDLQEIIKSYEEEKKHG